jgi:hydrogenase maturation protease
LNGKNNILVIGIGNEMRGDDAAGLLAAMKLRELRPEGITVKSCCRDGSTLLILWEGYDDVILIDAISGEEPAGSVHVIDMHTTEYTEEIFRASSHSIGLFETIKLAGYVGKVPERLILYGIGGNNFTVGDEPSPEVVAGVDRVVSMILERRG